MSSAATEQKPIDIALAAIEQEPELPGDMPDDMWEAIKGDRDAVQEAMRIAVRQTKGGIRDRYYALRAQLSETETIEDRQKDRQIPHAEHRQASETPTAFAIFDIGSDELVDAVLLRPEDTAGIRIEPLFTAISEDAERYRWFRDHCSQERRLTICDYATDGGMLDHHIDKGRCGLE